MNNKNLQRYSKASKEIDKITVKITALQNKRLIALQRMYKAERGLLEQFIKEVRYYPIDMLDDILAAENETIDNIFEVFIVHKNGKFEVLTSIGNKTIDFNNPKYIGFFNLEFYNNDDKIVCSSKEWITELVENYEHASGEVE